MYCKSKIIYFLNYMHCLFILFVDREMNGIEAYFCHHLSANYVYLSDLNVGLVNYIYIYVDVSDPYNIITSSSQISNFYIVLMALTAIYLSV